MVMDKQAESHRECVQLPAAPPQHWQQLGRKCAARFEIANTEAGEQSDSVVETARGHQGSEKLSLGSSTCGVMAWPVPSVPLK